MILLIAFLTVRTGKLVSKTDPFFSMMTMAKDETEPIDLGAMNFIFAIEDIDPRAGRVVVKHTAWGPGKNKQEANGKLYVDSNRTTIEMVDCASLSEDPKYDDFHIATKLLLDSIALTRKGTKFLCPVNLESLVVRGHYGAKYFEYVKISI